MGYCNQDLADHNFLYDEVNNKIYAIDFTDIEICNENVGKLVGTFYLSDIGIRVTFDAIINDIY